MDYIPFGTNAGKGSVMTGHTNAELSGIPTQGTIDINNLGNINPDKLNAEIGVGAYNDYQQRYVPFENEYIKQVTDPNYFAADIERVGTQAAQQYEGAVAAQNRTLSRYGIGLNADEQATLQRINKFGANTAVGSSLSKARRAFSDIRLDSLNFIADAFRQQEADAAGIAGPLAQGAAQRKAANQVASAQNQASTVNTLATVGTIAAMAFLLA